MFLVLKRTVSSTRDGSFEYPQHMFWLRNKKNNFQLHTLIWGPDLPDPELLYACIKYYYQGAQWLSGRLLESMTPDRGVAGSSLTGATALWSLSKTHLS